MGKKPTIEGTKEADNVTTVVASPAAPSCQMPRHLAFSSPPIYLSRRIQTTREAINSLEQLERTVCEQLVKVGDITILNPEEVTENGIRS